MKRRLTLGILLLIGCLLFGCQVSEQETTNPPQSILQTPQIEAFESPVGPGGARFDGMIAFHSERSGNLQIYVLYGDTGETKRLTTEPGGAFEPSWSPDCKSLAFASEPDPGSFEIYTIQIDGNKAARLFENQPADDWSPAWSPTGEVIAYQTNETGKINICFVNLEGDSQGCLKSDFSNALPTWSPDGSKLLFISNRDGEWNVYVTDYPVASESTQLTNNNGIDMRPQFSPDGQFIVFSSKHVGNYDIFVMKSDGTQETQLTSGGTNDVNPHWVGNEQIVFASERTGDWELYLMDRDGGNLKQLTDIPGLDKWPAWCAESW